MTRELIEGTAREWVLGSRARGRTNGAREDCSPKDVAESLVELAARAYLADNRVW